MRTLHPVLGDRRIELVGSRLDGLDGLVEVQRIVRLDGLSVSALRKDAADARIGLDLGLATRARRAGRRARAAAGLPAPSLLRTLSIAGHPQDSLAGLAVPRMAPA